MKFHEKPSSGSRVVGWGQADMTKLFTILFMYVFLQCCQDSIEMTYRCAEYINFTTNTRLDREHYLAWYKRIITDKLAINQLLKQFPPFFLSTPIFITMCTTAHYQIILEST